MISIKRLFLVAALLGAGACGSISSMNVDASGAGGGSGLAGTSGSGRGGVTGSAGQLGVAGNPGVAGSSGVAGSPTGAAGSSGVAGRGGSVGGRGGGNATGRGGSLGLGGFEAAGSSGAGRGGTVGGAGVGGRGGGTAGGAGGTTGLGGRGGSPFCACSAIYSPVCGSDGQTYANECTAACNGVSIVHTGTCATECMKDGDCTSWVNTNGCCGCMPVGGKPPSDIACLRGCDVVPTCGCQGGQCVGGGATTTPPVSTQ